MFNQIVDYIVFLSIVAFLLYNFYIMFNMIFSDLKKPYIGIASSYIFNFFIFDTLAVAILTRGFFCWQNLQGIRVYQIYFLAQLIAIYNATIFLIKKYNYTYIKNEAKLTCLLVISLYMIIGSFLSLPIINVVPKEKPTSYFYWVYFINCAYGRGSFVLPSFLFAIRLFPLVLLGTMWVHSVSKKYNKYEMSYFTKSSNKTIFTFLFYEGILSCSSFFYPQNGLEIISFLVLLFATKITFVKSILAWMQHPDMESIETNAILRSQKND